MKANQPEGKVQNRLAALRQSRGLSATHLAGQAGVSRQTIYAIESGSYVPNTEVTLRLARALAVPVEELFFFDTNAPSLQQTAKAGLLSATPAVSEQAVRIGIVNGTRVCVPVQTAPCFLPEADGIVVNASKGAGSVEYLALSRDDDHSRKLVIAGCDPAIGLVAIMAEKLGGIEIISAPASSKLALSWLKQGKVHVAGSHLEDPATGEFNLPYLRAAFPRDDFAVISFARWEEGLVVAPGNPKRIRKVEDLARKTVRFVNREEGSGSRALLDRLLARAGVPDKRVSGYDRISYGHLASAYRVFAGDADCCLATRSAAKAFQLDFVPLKTERYDLVMRRDTLSLRAAEALLDSLQRAALRKKLEAVAGYDTSPTGTVLA